jgi:hypothetical protein
MAKRSGPERRRRRRKDRHAKICCDGVICRRRRPPMAAERRQIEYVASLVRICAGLLDRLSGQRNVSCSGTAATADCPDEIEPEKRRKHDR